MPTRKKRLRRAAIAAWHRTADAFLDHGKEPRLLVRLTDKGMRKAIELLEAMPDAELAKLADAGSLAAQKVRDARTRH